MSFRLISVPLVCEGVKLAGLGKNQIIKSKLQIFIPLIDFFTLQKMSLSSKLPRFSKKNQFLGKFG